MGIKEITAWETSDGQVFAYIGEARKAESRLQLSEGIEDKIPNYGNDFNDMLFQAITDHPEIMMELVQTYISNTNSTPVPPQSRKRN